MHVWYKFSYSSSNTWRVIVRTRLSSRTNGRTGGQKRTEATTIALRPERRRGNDCICNHQPDQFKFHRVNGFWVIFGRKPPCGRPVRLTHWGRVTHICVSKFTIIGLNNGLSPGRRETTILANEEILLIWSLGTNFSEILIEIHISSFNKCIWKCRLRSGGHFVSASIC